jgi:hypothetical protein
VVGWNLKVVRVWFGLVWDEEEEVTSGNRELIEREIEAPK